MNPAATIPVPKPAAAASFHLRLPFRHTGITLGLSLQAMGSPPQHVTPGREGSTRDQPRRETAHPAQRLPSLLCGCTTAPLPILGLWHIQRRGQARSLLSGYAFHRRRFPISSRSLECNCFKTSLILLLFIKPRQPTAFSKARLTTSLQQLSGKQLVPSNSPTVTSQHQTISQDFLSH